MRGLLLLCLVGVSAGCGPIEYVTTVTFQASKAVNAAKRAGAPERAVYEWTLSTEYLHKARELAGFARYQEAIGFGKDALKWAHKAEVLAIEKKSRPDEKSE
jgi:hypothetical protein